MSTLKLSTLFFLCVIVAGCAQLKPFEDRRREPGTQQVYVGASRPQTPAICYNPLWNDKDDTKAIADELCRQNKAKTHAEFVKVEYFSCRLFVPAKAFYKCVDDQ